MNKHKQMLAVAGVIAVTGISLGVLLWWFIPYFHTVRGWDQNAGYRYYIEGDAIVLTEYTGNETVIYIPERLKGRKVVVGGSCFSGADIEEVYVPSTVEVGKDAFHGCASLRKFSGSSNHTIYSGTFLGDESLEEVQFTNEIEIIEGSAFKDCIKFDTVDLLEDVRYLGHHAFWGTAIEELPSMENLEYVGNDVFWETPWEEKQEGDFVIVGNTLQLYKGSDQVVHIPERITAIRTAFLYWEEYEYPIQVKEVYIPDTVKTLGYNAFLNQEDLTVYIPASVTEIEIDKFGEIHEMEGNIKIITTAGSYAEEYAKEYGV
ncbi:MAG: leucine-rich repeat domain-containing protein, partial [Bacillota bacterium]|nr:leucine-rich repeat domain-containing protein [Bacillota bacterium]